MTDQYDPSDEDEDGIVVPVIAISVEIAELIAINMEYMSQLIIDCRSEHHGPPLEFFTIDIPRDQAEQFLAVSSSISAMNEHIQERMENDDPEQGEV